MTDNTCNGWRNAATWTVNLWFGDMWAAMAEDGEAITAEMCRDFVEDHVRDVIGEDNGFIWDMMDLRAVDWEELADAHALEQDAAA